MMATLNHSRIELTTEVPAGWETIRIRGSSMASWDAEAGIVMIENITVARFSIMVVRVFLKSAARLELTLPDSRSYFIFCVEGNWQIINRLSSTDIQQDQYQFLFSDSLELLPLQVPGRMNQLLLISSSTENFITEKELTQPLNANTLLIEQVFQLIHTSYFPRPRPFHEKLISSVLQMAEADGRSGKLIAEQFTTAELDALYKVSAIIEKDLQQHHSINSLALYSGMNRQKLTSGFKAVFGQTIYTYYLSKRMELAKHLLVTSHLPIKLVSKKAGYRNTTNFSIAFKKFYQLTPAQMRRKKPD